jgi:uncharacterized membrane protein
MHSIKLLLKYLLAIAFIAAGVNHFVNPAFYLKIMPPVLPAPLFLIYLSGFFQIALGVALLIPKYTRLAAWGIVALLIAVFPANIYMAMNAELFSEYNRTLLYLRLPVQFVFIWWAFYYTKMVTDIK